MVHKIIKINKKNKKNKNKSNYMSISYIETNFFHNLKIDNDEINQLNFLHQRKRFLYQKLLNNH